MQTRRMFVILVILGVLLSACQSFPPDKEAEVAQPTQIYTVTPTMVVSTATVIVPTPVPQEAVPESFVPVEPTTISMAIPSGVFRSGFPLVIPRTQHTATLLKDGKILIAGGSVENDDFAVDEELIDPITGVSRWTAPLHNPRHGHSATLLQDGRVLVVGGYNLPEQWIEDAEIYDPQSDTWTVIPPNHPHGTAHSATRLKDGRVLIVGGCIGSGVCTNLVEIFDPRTNTWLEAVSLQEDRWGHTAQLLDDGRVLIAGGSTADGNLPLDRSTLIYNPTTNTWQTAAPMLVNRFMTESVKLPNGNVLVAGGVLLHSSEAISNAVEIYDPGTNIWRSVAPLNQARYTFTLRVIPDGRVIAISGAREWDNKWTPDSFVHEIELFDPATGHWQVVGELPEPGAFSSGTQLKDGRIWIAGGQAGAWVLDETWLIQP